MVETIQAMGLPAYVPVSGNGCVRTQRIALRDMLARLGHAVDKRIPSLVGEWPPQTISSFLDAMVEGDGSRHKQSGHRVIYTVSRHMADELQILAIKSGISANLRVDDRTGLERVMPSGQRFRNPRPCYVVSLVSRRNKPLVNHNRKAPSVYWNAEGCHDGFEPYGGSFHCAEVPNGLLLVRRGGKPVVSGGIDN
ncbi:LAGLIDADG family homing endonuclease [Nonomuraea sp. B19D2]|uniref:LAGLIDADG family homing endonuclease n=1 Tax=Nonomuraea sp. B19D2 TaxID=3159561 RepID=UPI0032D9BAB7